LGKNLINLIWDLDGTLIDSQEEILYHLEFALKKASLNIADQIKPIRTGPPIDIMLKESFPAEMLTEEKLNEVIYDYRERYNNSGFKMTGPFNGIEEIISDTINFTHYVVTNKPYLASRRIIEKMGWADKVTSLKTQSEQIEQRKSKSELFAELMTELGGDSSSFIGIGDMKSDCLAARDNNIIAVGVLWGSGTREELSDCCDYLCKDTIQLHDFLYDRGNV
jgi:phosphoglycolate phosphatase